MQRPRKPSLSDIKEKKFSESIRGLRHRPHNGIVNRIDSKMFSLDGNRVYHYKPEVLASEEYKRCLELFERRLSQDFALSTPQSIVSLQMRMSDMMNVIFTKEMRHLEELKQIAVDTIRSLLSIPEHVKILPDIDTNLDISEHEQDDSSDHVLSLTPEEQRKMYQEIQKRIILNGLVHGAAMHIWKSAHYIIKDRIDELDPMLMELYDRYTTSIGYLIWQAEPDEFQNAIETGAATTQGFNRLEFEEEGEPECNVHCHAINFPVLLHEVTKGAMDYLICRGIPKEYSEEELRYYYAIADSYENEYWHYLLSPTLWTRFLSATDLDTQELPIAIARLTQLSYDELVEVMIACIESKELGNLKLKSKKIV